MSFLRGLENASATFLTAVTTTEQDRIGDTVETNDWETMITLPVRYQDDTHLEAGEYARHVTDTPAVFVDAERFPVDLYEDHADLDPEDWPFVAEGETRIEIRGETYLVTEVHEQTMNQRREVDFLALELGEV